MGKCTFIPSQSPTKLFLCPYSFPHNVRESHEAQGNSRIESSLISTMTDYILSTLRSNDCLSRLFPQLLVAEHVDDVCPYHHLRSFRRHVDAAGSRLLPGAGRPRLGRTFAADGRRRRRTGSDVGVLFRRRGRLMG